MHPEHFALVLLELVLAVGLGLVGRALASALDQPEVLGELLMGIIIATVVHIGGGSFAGLVRDLTVFGNLGVILMLFSVGIGSNLREIKLAGKHALLVAGVGVAAPMALGLLSTGWLKGGAETGALLFAGATLAATSISLTARVFKDLNMLGTREAKLVLSAAILDDVFGLILLSVVSGLALHGRFEYLPLFKTLVISGIFIGVVVVFGERLAAVAVENLLFLEPAKRRLLLPLTVCFTVSWLANEVGLAAILGAFAAGLILSDELFTKHPSPPLQEELAPLETLFAPVFFVLMGLQIDLSFLFHGHALALTLALCVAAVLGKLACAKVAGPEVNGLVVGISMLPRGEVGFIFAALGKALEVVDDELFTALTVAIIFSTVITPPALRWAVKRATR